MAAEILNKLRTTQERYVVLFLLIAWTGAAFLFGLIRLDNYGIDEGAARALILNWSISDQIINPVLVLGSPDLRALLFAPIGIYWSGSMLAAKIFSLFIGFFSAYMLFIWARNKDNQESALIATALLLVSPFMISQIDSMSAGPYLLLAFSMAAWLDKSYRKVPNYYGGWYFIQMLWILVIVTMHPMGLAYPIALATWWILNPETHKNSRHVFVGIAITTIISIAFKLGWSDLAWFSNPIQVLSAALSGAVMLSKSDINWLPGIIATAGLLFIVALDRKTLAKDLLGLMLIFALAIGLLAADATWATLALTLLLYRGVALLLRLNLSTQKMSFFGQRGIIAAVAFISCTFFMLQLKAHALTIKYDIYSPEDQLISELAQIAADDSKPFRAASQWPGRSMLATKRDVLPLPPAFENPEELKEKALTSLTHIIFDPYLEKNKALAGNLSMLSGETETTAILKGGALLTVVNHNVKLYIRPNDDVSAQKAVDPGNEQKDPIEKK